jgi:hypothetical protein
MVKRNCPKCNTVFDRKYCYDRHINKKFDCSKNNNIQNENLQNLENFQNILNFPNTQKIVFQKFPNAILENANINIKNNDELNIDLNCTFCTKTYSSKGNLTKHLKNCKIKKENEVEKESIFKLLLEKDKQKDDEICELKKQNKLLMDKIDKLISMKENSNSSKITNNSSKIINNSSKIINNTQSITNNINSNNTQNIVMVNFGKEDLSIIDEKIFIDRIVKKPLLSGVKIPDEVLKIIHFNPMYPQLSNIYISDINREKCMVWEDGEWILSNVDNIPFIMDKVCLFSTDQINTLKNKHPNNKPLQERLCVIEKYNNMIDNDYIDELKDEEYNVNKNLIKRCDDFQKNTYNTFKKTLYNEGKKIKKIIKQK